MRQDHDEPARNAQAAEDGAPGLCAGLLPDAYVAAVLDKAGISTGASRG